MDMNLLHALRQAGVEYDARQSDRLLRRRNLEPESAALLAVVLRAMSVKRMLTRGEEFEPPAVDVRPDGDGGQLARIAWPDGVVTEAPVSKG